MTSTLPQTDVALDVTPLSARIGAEIRGVDLRSLSDAEVGAIRAAWLEHKVVFFPGQHLEPVEHLAFAARLGEPTEGHPLIPGLADHPEVFEIDYTKQSELAALYGDVAERSAGLSWHTDVTFVKRPPAGSILRAVVVPDAGGDTLFSNQQAAYEGLSPSLQGYLSTLTAVHDGRHQFAKVLELVGEGTWEGERYASLDPVEHPVVITHPETGKRVLFVNPGFTSHIKDLSRAESDALLGFLYAHSVRPEYVVRYHWQAGTLGFWDNFATQHSVVGDYGDRARVIQRVTLRGAAPVA